MVPSVLGNDKRLISSPPLIGVFIPEHSYLPVIYLTVDSTGLPWLWFKARFEKFSGGSFDRIIILLSGSTADWAYDTADIPCAYAPELRDQGEYRGRKTKRGGEN